MSPGEDLMARVAASFARMMLALYPRAFRKEMGASIVHDVRHRAAELRRRRGRLAAALWLPRLVLSMLANAAGVWRDEPPSSKNTMESILQDIRFGLRSLRRNPGFTAVALLTLTLGIGANTAVFSVVNGVVLRPLPYPAPEQLVLLYGSNARSGELLGRVSYQDLEDWRSRTRSLGSMAGFAAGPTILTGRGDPLEVEMTYVTPDFFRALGVEAQLGRLHQEDDHRLALRSAVVSETLWRNVLGADPGVLGQTILIRGDPFTVVGVAPASLRHPTPETDLWVPQSLVEPNMFSNGVPTRGDRYLEAFGRLAPGADPSQAQSELTALARELAATYPDTNADWGAAAVVSLHDAIVGDVDQALLTVLSVVGLILLIACANLANLLLARGSARQAELAVRTTLGAGRRRVVRQLLTESLMLALLGGVLGLALSWWGVRSILRISAETLPRVQDVHVDAQVIGFTLVLTLLTGLVFGLVPALRMTQSDPQRHLRGGRGNGGGEGQRLRSGLVVAQVAVAVLLLIGAGLMGRSFMALRGVDPGFEPEGVLTATMQLNLTGISDEEMAGFLVQRREEILRRVHALPGVASAGTINVFPLHSGAFTLEYTASGGGAAPDAPGVHADTRYVSPGYLRTMGIPLLQGNGLPDRLAPGEPVSVLMSESAARRLWPSDDPVGRLIDVPWGEAVVVGVVGDVRQIGLAQEAQPAIYFPQLIAPRLMTTLVVRTSGDPTVLADPIQEIVKEIDPNQPIRTIQPLTDLMAESIAQERFFTLLFAVFGGLALALSAVGVYGVLAYAVRQRTQEIGLRIALGASAGDVLRLVAGGGMKLVGIGALIGTAGALALTRVLASQLYGVTPTDPLAFGLAVGFLGAIALLASYLPARRAMQLPPRTALSE